MSQQPRHVPTHTSSPSNPTSRRTTSGGGGGGQQQQQPSTTTTTTPTTRSLLPSPHFEDDPIVASHQQAAVGRSPSLTLNNPEYSEHAVAESEHYSHGLTSGVHPGELAPIPSFQPFFTLIEDSVTNEHHHPKVHYIFADDDADIITEAALRSLETLDPAQRSNRGGVAPHGRLARTLSHAHTDAPRGPRGQDDSINAPRLPPPTADMREHYVILDVHPQPRAQNPDDTTPAGAGSSGGGGGGGETGYNYEVTSAHSLSAEWQVLRTSISAAPTIGDGPSEEGEGLMLRIEGRGNTPGDLAAAGREKAGGDAAERERERERESMEEMIDRFQRRLDDIRMVIEAGGISGGGGAVGAAAALGGED